MNERPTEKDFPDIVHTGPGTIGGRYLRSFWQPVHVGSELAARKAKPLRVMGEDFTLFRGSGGTAQVLAPHCPHRATQLSTGWVEGEDLRCFYHGWKFEASGQCVEAPAEREGFARTVRIRSYPTREYLGLIFAYLGDGEPPEFPRYTDLEDDGILDAREYRRDCNFFNNIENQCDPVHVAFAHRTSAFTEGGLIGVPQVSAEETDWGLALTARRQGVGVRVTQVGMPNILHIKSSPMTPESGWSDLFAWRVPIDDYRHSSFNIHLHRLSGEAARNYLAKRDMRERATARPIREVGAAIRRGELHIDDVKDHPNIVGIQDDVAQIGQGAIADRKNERLGRSDVGVVLVRNLWLRELRALANGQTTKNWRWRPEIAVTVGAPV
jgi:5,5'-dehydrodivanillate O-demethylase